jgi:iron complex outermembrane receptor protein
MRSNTTRRAALAAAMSMGLGMYGVSALAAEAIEEVVVTGSHIKGTAEDAALPVDVIDRGELEVRGNPNALDMIRAMPYVTGVMGETNQFGPNQGTIGVGNVNLRGLGGMRTLVLMNGRRTTYTPAEGPTGVDTNLLPMAAVGRVEVLKDGAAALYGSDAIAGVVNFITRRDLDGLELQGEFRGIEDSDGDYTGSINWGWVGDHSNVLVSYSKQKRSELSTTDRDWAFPDYIENPTGWSTLSTPGTFVPIDFTGGPGGGLLVGAQTKDSNCTALGGHETPSSCYFSYVPFDNLVEETDQQQLYTELNSEIADDLDLHLEALWAETVLPDYRTSPGYPPLTGPGGPGFGQFFVQTNAACPTPFCNNPGALAALQQSGAINTIPGADRLVLAAWRPQGWGGVPQVTGGKGGQLIRNSYDIYRFSGGLAGTFDSGWSEGIGWDVNLTYSSSTFDRSGVDTVITRLQNALNGLGGPDCNGIAFGLPGSTCLFFNPFSNSIARNPALGLDNPGFIEANANSADIVKWMTERGETNQEQSLFVADAVLNGELPWFELPGGAIGWAFGGQYRKIDYQSSVSNDMYDARINPCINPNDIPGQGTCTFTPGPFIFLGQFIPADLDESVHAVFTEFALPILENLEAQVAIRYEDYGGLTGDTTDPKFSLRWQATDWIAFRGSVGSTFRGPTPVNKSLHATGLQPVSATGNRYLAIDTTGDPALKPESADTTSFGVIVQWEGLELIVDYWSYEFEDRITTVPYNAIGNAVGIAEGNTAPITGAQLANCNHGLRDLVIFSNNNTCIQGVTTGAAMERIRTVIVNGSPVEVTGYDVGLHYDFGEMFGGGLTAGIDATLVDKYDIDALFYNGVLAEPAYKAAGFANQQRDPGGVSEMKAIGNINYNYQKLNARYEVRYTEGVEDDRPQISAVATDGSSVPVTFGMEVDDYWMHNLFFTYEGPWETQISLAIVNLLDEDPPEVRHQISYDPYFGDPLGRTWELGIRKTFGFN